MKEIYNWFVRSSADPRNVSLFVKGILMMLVSWIGAEGAQIMGIMCDIGSYCYPVTPDFIDQLTYIVDIITQAVFFLLSLIGCAVALVGGVRKVLLTYKGKNHIPI